MKYISTRLKAPVLSFKEVVMQGLASDGGLYVPENLPQFSAADLEDMKSMNYQELFFKVTREFVGDDISDTDYKNIIAKSYKDFNHAAIAPFKQIAGNEFFLELFHGPTLAFKDYALQFLGNLLDHLLKENGEKIAVIGATSGDTGSAAIEGCMKCENAKIFIMHPYQKVSEVQRRQMTTVLADNVFNIAIEGNFDDSQNFVKKMFIDQEFLKGRRMVAVNSINWARIMGQIVYYFYCGLKLSRVDGKGVSFTVPTGNFGDIYAGFLAKRMGLHVEKLIIATNDNNILTRFIDSNDYTKLEMIETVTPSMNIQVSSNFERMLYDIHKDIGRADELADLIGNFGKTGSLKVKGDALEEVKKHFTSYSINDQETIDTVAKIYEETSEVIDPHSAIGVLASRKYMQSKDYQGEHVVNLATAHPAKFPDAIKQAGLKEAELPKFLQGLFEREERYDIIPNKLDAVKEFIASKL